MQHNPEEMNSKQKSRDRLSIKPAVDSLHDVKPPLDFTFLCLTSMSDCLGEEPRTPPGKKKQLPSPRPDGKKYNTNALRLSNNVLATWTDFCPTVETLIEEPQQIEWIDLSFNDLSTIDKCLLNYPNLKVLYLHGNAIEKITEVDKLAQLPYLRTLTIHGNPVEEDVKGYRQYVLSRLPQIKNFDFSAVTKQDRASAQTWSEMYKPTRKRKPIE